MLEKDEFEKQQISDIGKFFAQLRYKRKKTQREIGEWINGSQMAVTQFERAQSDFKFTTLQTFARAFGYRVKVVLVPLDEGIDTELEARPNPDEPISRTDFDTNSGRSFGNRKPAVRKPRPRPPVSEGPQVEYETDDEFDIEKEMAAMRERFGVN